ncbi:unnamed protein product [Adineta steineri]|uniref:Uncharacterized protein n=1 Tax=Adineta steineri TaxID=433720 RepID=A0A818SRP7_9BILA|nr:unnamed protein product [Adineta steineri]CAF3676508.1 unnamed protein product [Adineta steineri]
MDVIFDSAYNSSIFIEDSIDEYLIDPNLTVSEMVEKYKIAVINNTQKKEKRDLRCAVCNARAFGYNFDQISCESCKAFFRRNALKNINDLHCRFSGTCNITTDTRRHCSYCRINKCFAVGMKKEWIRSEEDKLKRRGRTEKSRRRKFSQQPITIPAVIDPGYCNYPSILSSLDLTRLNNISHCYDQFTREPSVPLLGRPPKSPQLRIDEMYERKKPIFINLINYFKHLPELRTLNTDDQVALIKQNIRLLIPLNYAILKTPRLHLSAPRFRTIGCMNDVDLHVVLRSLADTFVDFVIQDPIVLKLYMCCLFFSTNPLTTISLYNPAEYEQLNTIKQIQSSYIELLWLYMLEKCGEENSVHLLTKMVTKYLHVQIIIDQVDSIIRMNDDLQNMDLLMQNMLHLT